MKIIFRHIKPFAMLLLLAVLLFPSMGHSQDIPPTETNTIEYYFNQARDYGNRNQTILALESLNKAITIANKNEDTKSLIDCYHKFAILYSKMNKDDTSKFYWERAQSLLKDIAYPYGNAVHKYIEAIRSYRLWKNFLAKSKLYEAQKLNNDRNLLNHILFLEGIIFMKLENYDDAIKNFNSLLVNSDIYEKDYLTTISYLKLAEVYFTTAQIEESIKNAENALSLAKQHGFYEEMIEANRLLSELNRNIGNFQMALSYTNNIVNIKDSVLTIQKVKAEEKTAEKIQFTIMSEEIKKQEAKIEDLNKSANRSEITAILTSAFLTIISLLAVSLYRNNQIKVKTNDLLQTKNRELQSATDAAVQAMEAKTNFLSTVSHELRTPLYAVTGLTHLLLEENPSPSQKEHLKSLKYSGDYLLNFINDILQINKIDAQKSEALKIDFNIQKILWEVINSLQQSAKKNNTVIKLDFDNNIPSHLLGDPLKLSQVFINLIGNAIKFTRNGEVQVISKLVKKENDEAILYFEVKDNGIGISPDRQKTIFESFEQGSVQINREYGGTGLGLTIVKSLLKQFGSKIHLKSDLGKGSSFFFEIALKSNQDLTDDTPFENVPRDYDFKGLHMLIVEDNKINQVITKKMLNKKEITCDIANNGMEAIDMVKNNYYDGILMDIHMPGISGDEATIEIRKFNRLIPIIALTAISLDDSLESFFAAGVNDVVTKPFRPEVFYQKIGENIFDTKNNTSVS